LPGVGSSFRSHGGCTQLTAAGARAGLRTATHEGGQAGNALFYCPGGGRGLELRHGTMAGVGRSVMRSWLKGHGPGMDDGRQ